MRILFCLISFLLCSFITPEQKRAQQEKVQSCKIYDCFPFFNELEVLKIRFDELYDIVDYFVLVESMETHKGEKKPLYFAENKHLFEKYLPKVIHVIIDERHPEMSVWGRENYQRNCILRGLTHCSPDDLIIISDADEIPKKTLFPSIMLNYYHTLFTKKGYVSLQQDIYFFQLNRQTPTKETWGGGYWVGTSLATYEAVASNTPQYYRDKRAETGSIISHGGWHFTWMGGKEAVRKKTASGAEPYNPDNFSDEAINAILSRHPPVPIDSSFPDYVVKNQEYLKSIDYIAD